jgi:predicted extracellular nuclease
VQFNSLRAPFLAAQFQGKIMCRSVEILLRLAAVMCVAFGLAGGANAALAAALAAWDVNGLTGGANNFGASPLAPTTVAANLTVAGLTRGAGVGATGTAAARAWGGVDWQGATAAAAVTANDVVTFSVTPNAGFQVSFSAIPKFDYRRSATGASNGVLQYQIGSGAFIDITALSYPSTASTGGSIAAINLSSIGALQNVPPGTTVTFRIVNYGGTSSGGTWYIFDVANSTAADLQVDGTVSVSGPINGACDSANGQSFTSAPTTNLCTAGITSAVTGSGPWNWTCGGINGGTTASCSATLNTNPVNGVCGSANGQSFVVAPATNLCSAGTATSVTGTGPWGWSCAGANGGGTSVCSANLTTVNLTPIYTIQGSGATSPLAGQSVTTSGVVTKVNNNGFYLQDPVGDGNPLTSDGIFVFTSTTPTVTAGQLIQLTGTVSEFNTGAAGNTTTVAHTVTELTAISGLTVLGAGTITPAVITLPLAAADDMERYEGMLVQITNALTASQNFFQGRYGQITLSAGGRLFKPTNLYTAGSPDALALANLNARLSIMLDDGTSLQNPNPTPYIGADNTLRAGDTLPGGITGVIDYGLATSDNTGIAMYRIHPTATPVFTRSNPRTTTPPAVGGNIKVGSFNVLNFFTTFTNGNTAGGQSGQGCSLGASVAAANCRGADDINEFNRQRTKIVQAMAAINADVFGLMEIQNNGNTAAQNLVDALNAVVGANTYAVAPLPPDTGTDAIRVAIIYKPATLNLFGASMSDSNSIHNRPPFARTFSLVANGEKFSVVVNHFKSKGSCPGDNSVDDDQNDGQGCWNDRRKQQAQALLTFIGAVQAAASDNDVIVIGDLNAYGAEDPVNILTAAGLVNQISRFEGTAGYSYVFDGEAGYLDHALATPSLSAQINAATHWHINADEPSIIDYNLEFKQPACGACGPDYYTATPYRASDHDPVMIGLNLGTVLLSQTITFTAPADRAVNSGSFAVTATAMSGLVVTFASNTTAVCGVTAPGTVTLLTVGVCSLTASQPGNGVYAAATPVIRTFTITAALLTQTINFTAIPNKTLGALPFTATATATSGLPVTIVSQSITVCSVSGSTVTILAVGTCVLDAAQPGNGVYGAAPTVTQSFTITSGGGADAGGDVPLPLWALILLGAGLLGPGALRGSRRVTRL